MATLSDYIGDLIGYVDSEGNTLTDSIFVNVLDSVYNEGGTSIYRKGDQFGNFHS